LRLLGSSSMININSFGTFGILCGGRTSGRLTSHLKAPATLLQERVARQRKSQPRPGPREPQCYRQAACTRHTD
jgi:hypothetical protein